MHDDRKIYDQLIEQANYHDQLYFSQARPTISDYEYDQLVKRIEKLEKKHPNWISPHSPTKKISSDTTPGFAQYVHKYPMLSLTNTYSKEDVVQFYKRICKALNHDNFLLHAELKIDGTAVSLHYKEGILIQALTRGDGHIGDDVTKNVKTIRNLSHKLQGKEIPHTMTLRGEVYLSLQTFQKLNQEKEASGEEPYANPRNAASGSLKLLNCRESALRNLSIIIYDWLDATVPEQSLIADTLAMFGLPVFPKNHRLLCSTMEEVFYFFEKMMNERPHLAFEIDGIVLKVNTFAQQKLLGTTGKYPKWSVAYKFPPQQTSTKIENIFIQVGRTGILTPIAKLIPTKLAGSTISRATLHNQNEIHRKDIRIGDSVIIEKGGDVIPKVVSINITERQPYSQKWEMPLHCPSCGHTITHVKGEAAIRCANTHCPAQLLQKFIFFCSKECLNIVHLGEKILHKLIKKKLLYNLSDIYHLSKKELSQIPHLKEKSIHNLLTSIEQSKNPHLNKFLLSLNIQHVGAITATTLADQAKTIENFLQFTEQDLLLIPGIGPIAAKSIAHYLSNPTCQKEIKFLLQAGVSPTPQQRYHNHPLFQKRIVLTGKLNQYSRERAIQKIEQYGGKVSNSVCASTHYLIVGENPGSKLKKARDLSIPILYEQDFQKLLTQ